MKKLLIGMLITCSLGLAGCGKTNTKNPSTNNNSGTGVTDRTNENGVTDGANGNGVTNGNGATNGNGVTNGTNPNINGTNTTDDSRTSVKNLYTEFQGKVEGGIENIKSEDWDKYSTEFRGKLTNLKNTVKDTSIRSTLDDMENLFNEYDTAIREKKDVAKDKVQEMRNRIENAFK